VKKYIEKRIFSLYNIVIMYFYKRSIKYVVYDEVYPLEGDKILFPAYKWLGNYCGYCPQIWLMKGDIISKSNIVFNIKDSKILNKYKNLMQKRSEIKEDNDNIVFEFNSIKGFCVSFQYWEFLLMFLLDNQCPINESLIDINKFIKKQINEIIRNCFMNNIAIQRFCSGLQAWHSCLGKIDLFLERYLFAEADQIVVPSLDLRIANRIICKDKEQKEKLCQMGFLENRITIEK